MIFRNALNAFVMKRQTDRLRREAFGVRRIPALCESSARREAKAPEYGALQTLRAVWLRLCRPEDKRGLPATDGFSLVELLVVITVIAALAALLLPTFARSKASAYRLKCLSNLRQLGLAAHMYWDDNNNDFFRYGGH